MKRLAILYVLYFLSPFFDPSVVYACSDIAGIWNCSFSETSCDGRNYNGYGILWVRSDCSVEGTDNWDTISGTVNPSTKVLTVTGISRDGCGTINGSGIFTADSVSGNYSYSYGGGGSFTGNIQPKIPASERASIIALYKQTGGDNWNGKTRWKAPPLDIDGFSLPCTECSWYGVGCNTQTMTVSSLNLAENKLRGNIPTELEKLSNLEKLNLRGNRLTGRIPPELGLLTNLATLLLYDNQLTGGIPAEIGNLSNIEYLTIGENNFTGGIPSTFGQLIKLKVLNLADSQLSGNIPPDLGHLINLERLSLNNNELSGAIPDELMNLNGLIFLDICNNRLYTRNPDLRDFLNSKQWGGDWESCQDPITFKSFPWIPLLLLDD